MSLLINLNGQIPATSSSLGSIKVGSNLSIDPDGTLNATGGGGGGTYITEIPSGTINGSNTTFSIAHAPLTNTESLYVNGVYQQKISDYTLSGVTITFIAAPVVGDKLTITYQY